MNSVEMIDIVKQYPLVRAVDHVSFSLGQGEIHSLLGENGAGKSTLMKILYGMTVPDEGEIRVNGEPVKIKSPKDAIRLGIGMVHQHFMLSPVMSVTENIIVNHEPRKGWLIDEKKAEQEIQALIDRFHFNINAKAKVQELSVGEQQRVEILKAIYRGANILILDEPTAVLTPQEVEELFVIMRNLKKDNKSIIIITHKLKETLAIADRISVLRDGKMVESGLPLGNVTTSDLAKMMVGRDVALNVRRENTNMGEEFFRIQDLQLSERGVQVLKGISLSIRKGEILGISGLMGAGRTELFTAVYGAFRTKGTGEIYIDGKKVEIKSPLDALKAGYFIVSEDRKKLGLNLIMSIKENTTLSSLQKVSKFGILNEDAEVAYTTKYVEEIRTKTPSIDVAVNTLSGGNQQKVVLAKALMSDPKVMILDEPTRGIDVGAKYEIYKIMNELVEKGVVIIMISSEMEEILGMSDRILTVAGGEITGEFDVKDATQEILMRAAVGRG